MNTSFNVAAPIAQSPVQAIDTLRRANGMDGVFMFSAEGSAVVIWIREPKTGAAEGFGNGSRTGGSKPVRVPRPDFVRRPNTLHRSCSRSVAH